MAADTTAPIAASSPKPGAHFRIAGVVVLLIGLITGGLVYCLSAAPERVPDDLATPENNKRSARDVESNFGHMGDFSYALGQALKDPATVSVGIAVTGALIAAGCFYIAHLQVRARESNSP